MNLIKQIKELVAGRSAWVYGFVAIRGAISILVFKMTSIFFGASGVALLSHFQNFIGLFTQVPDQGTNLGIMRLYHDKRMQTELFFHATILNIAVFAGVFIVVITSKSTFLNYFEGFLLEPGTLTFVFVAIFFMLFNSLTISFFYAKRAFQGVFWLLLFNFISLLVGLLLIKSTSIFMFMKVYVGILSFNSVVNTVVGFSFGVIPKWHTKLNKVVLRSIAGFLVIAAGGMVFGKLVDFFVRDFSMGWFGEEMTGYWQAQVRISDNIRALFLGTVGLIFYSRVSAISAHEERSIIELKQFLRLIILLVGIGLLLLYFFKGWIIRLLYSEDLLPAADFIHWQLLGDFFNLPAALLVYVIISQNKIGLFLKLHLYSAVIYVIALVIILGVVQNSVEMIPVANTVRQILFFLIVWNSFRKNDWKNG